MNQKVTITILVFAVLCLGACAEDAPSETAGSDHASAEPVFQSPGKPNLVPVDVKYRMLNEPEVGQPLLLELTLVSSEDAASLGYQLQGEDGLFVAPDNAAATFASKPAMSPETVQVSVTPQREGRFYLRVNANVITGRGSMDRVVTIPIQVGMGRRELLEHGELKQDDEGNPVVSLPAKEN